MITKVIKNVERNLCTFFYVPNVQKLLQNKTKYSIIIKNVDNVDFIKDKEENIGNTYGNNQKKIKIETNVK